MQTFLTLLFSLFFLGCSVRGADALAEKFRAIADYRTIRADFIQTRFLKELDMKVAIEGEMICEKNGRIRWQVKSPFRSITLIGSRSLEHFDGETGKTVVMDSGRLPHGIDILRDCLSEWISGDPDRLSKRFELAEKDECTLRLLPKNAGLGKLFSAVEITAGKTFDSIDRIRIEEASGDLLEIRFLNVVKNPPMSEEIWKMPGK